MKCLLCKGKGSFLVFKKDNDFNPYLGGSSYYVHEACPRCNGNKTEKYIPSIHVRMQSLFRSYGENYDKYFKHT